MPQTAEPPNSGLFLGNKQQTYHQMNPLNIGR